MKLFEIQVKTVNSKTLMTKKPTLSNSDRMEVLGSGQEAVVFQKKSPTHVGTVIKYIRNSTKDIDQEGTIQYLIRGNQVNNPLVPRVYSIRQIKKENSFDYIIEMEKLTEVQGSETSDPITLSGLLLSLFDPGIREPKKGLMLDEFEAIVTNAFRSQKTAFYIDCSRNVNDNAIHLRDMLNQIVSQCGGGIDIHLDNMMIRRTQHGSQIVISDPYYNRGSR